MLETLDPLQILAQLETRIAAAISEARTALTPAPPPLAVPILGPLTYDVVTGTVILTWSASEGAEGYTVLKDGVILASTNVLTYLVALPQLDAAYTVSFAVEAVRGVETALSLPVMVTVPAKIVPPPPVPVMPGPIKRVPTECGCVVYFAPVKRPDGSFCTDYRLYSTRHKHPKAAGEGARYTRPAGTSGIPIDPGYNTGKLVCIELNGYDALDEFVLEAVAEDPPRTKRILRTDAAGNVLQDDSALMSSQDIADWRLMGGGLDGYVRHDGKEGHDTTGTMVINGHGFEPGRPRYKFQQGQTVYPFSSQDFAKKADHTEIFDDTALEVVARSLPFLLPIYAPRKALTGVQQHSVTFEASLPITPTGNNPKLPGSKFQKTGQFYEQTYGDPLNPSMIIRAWGTHRPEPGPGQRTVFFVEHGHPMLIISDAGASMDSAGQTDSSVSLTFPKMFDISAPGSALEFYFQSDGVCEGARSWFDVLFTFDDEPLLNVGNLATADLDPVTPSRRALRWEIQQKQHRLMYIAGTQPPIPLADSVYNNPATMLKVARQFWAGEPILNGYQGAHDLRHSFFCRLSKERWTIRETNADASYSCEYTHTFTADRPLPSTRVTVHQVYQLYHSADIWAEQMVKNFRGPALTQRRDLWFSRPWHMGNYYLQVTPGSPVPTPTPTP